MVESSQASCPATMVDVRIEHRLELPPPLHGSLSGLDLAAVMACSTALRRAAAEATSLEDAAGRLARHLHHGFGSGAGPDAVLTRVFATAGAGELEPELRALVSDADDADPCLVLLATIGDQPDWCDRRTSRDHRVLRLTGRPGKDPLDSTPMIRALFDQFGIEPGDVGAPDGRLAFADVGVFHVGQARGSALIPGQRFVEDAGVVSVVGFGCTLADGRVVAVLQFSRVEIPVSSCALYRTLAVSLHLALVPVAGATLLEGQDDGARQVLPLAPSERERLAEAAARRGLERLVTVLGETIRAQSEQLRAEAALIEELRRLGVELSCVLDLDQLVDLVVSSAVRATGADQGTCFYDRPAADGRTRRSARTVGRDGYSSTWQGGATLPSTAGEVLAPALRGEAVVRVDDLCSDPSSDRTSLLSDAQGRVRSYLAAPVVSRCGEVLGTLVLGHPSPGAFDQRAEALLVGIAGHAALGMDNARLFTQQRETASELQRSLLPEKLPARPGLAFDARYQPGGSGDSIVVGGDWYDVVALDADRTAVVIGDVMGRGLRAAAAMGQLRTALRALLAGGLDPSAALVEVDRLIGHLPDERIATCAVGIYDPVTQTLVLRSAGHLPALLVPPHGSPVLVGGEPSGPLGALGAPPEPATVPFPPGSALLLFTDGLVERRCDGLDTGLSRLCEVASQKLELDLDVLLEEVLHGEQNDDTAVLLVLAVHRDGTTLIEGTRA